MNRFLFAAILSLFFISPAMAQGYGGVNAQQPITIGDCVKFTGPNTIADFGAECDGTGAPGGSNTQLQYNNAGSFGGISGATTDGTKVTFGSGDLLGTNIKLSGTAASTLQIGASVDTIAPVVFSVNTSASPPSPIANSLLHLIGKDGTALFQENDSYAGNNTIRLTRHDGTAASPTAVGASENIGAIQTLGYDGSTVSLGAAIQASSVGAWTTGNHGTTVTWTSVFSGATASNTMLILDATNSSTDISGNAGAEGLRVPFTTSAVNRIQITGATTGNAPTITSAGSDTNPNLDINAQGTGNIVLGNHLTVEGVTSTGATGTGNLVFSTSPTLVSPALGTPASGVATNLTGTASGLTAGTVTTNANLTGPITSSGNATSIAAQTGTGSTFVVQTSPVIAGHFSYSGSVPSITAGAACGTGTPVIESHSTDNAGTVTIGTVATSCVITFANAFSTYNHCRVTSQGVISGLAYVYTKSAITISASVLGGDTVDYNCDGV